jgi:dipeptidyl aminopeptidase/acylaminoacyl peptidase
MFMACGRDPGSALETNTRAAIFPEYYDLTIPPNIAPLNFVIGEPGSRFRAEFRAGDGDPIVIRQRSPSIRIPRDDWQNMLTAHAGETLRVDIWSFNDGTWHKYRSIEHHIAPEPIDPWLVYRLVHAVYLKWRDMGIFQRNLTNYDEIPVIRNSSTGHGCMNCHAFANNDPSKMLIHFRIVHPGTLLWSDGKLSKVDTRTPEALSAGIYPAWHPDGKHIAFSTGQISPHLTTRLNKAVDVADRKSDLVVYDLENHTVSSSPVVSTGRRENMPVWSPDGRTLYYLSAPEAAAGDDESLLHSRYSLMCVPYSAPLNKWGDPEMVLNADSTGMSISMPSISPEGRYMICSMADYGYFNIFDRESDLYCIDLGTRRYKKLELNSESAESFSSWSSNGRWLVFSSKRMDDVFSRTFIAYFDKDGVAHNPFVLPQKDPQIYYSLLANYNLPRLIKGKIELSPGQIRDMVLEDPEPVKPGN